MQQLAPGIHRDDGRLLTENLVPGRQVYGEHLLDRDGVEYRAWNPNRSKLAAALRKGLPWDLPRDATVLYLGAANGTTASHVSDVVTGGTVVCVEVSPRAMRDLLEVVEDRENMIPVLADAKDTGDVGRHLPGRADLVYQDIAQRDQVGIFLANLDAHLAEDGIGVLMVKARSVDVAADPDDVFVETRDAVEDAGRSVAWSSRLEPFERDHCCLLVR